MESHQMIFYHTIDVNFDFYHHSLHVVYQMVSDEVYVYHVKQSKIEMCLDYSGIWASVLMSFVYAFWNSYSVELFNNN